MLIPFPSINQCWVSKICSLLSRTHCLVGKQICRQENAIQCERCSYCCKYRGSERIHRRQEGGEGHSHREQVMCKVRRQEARQVWGIAASALREATGWGSWGMSEMDGARPGHNEPHQRFPNFLTSLLSQHVSYFFTVPWGQKKYLTIPCIKQLGLSSWIGIYVLTIIAAQKNTHERKMHVTILFLKDHD